VNVAVRVSAPAFGGHGNWPGDSEMVVAVVVVSPTLVVSKAAAAELVVVATAVVVGAVVVGAVVVGAVVVGVVVEDVVDAVVVDAVESAVVATTSPLGSGVVGADASVANWSATVEGVDEGDTVAESELTSVESFGALTTIVLLLEPITPVATPAAAMIAPVASAVRIAVRRGVERVDSVDTVDTVDIVASFMRFESEAKSGSEDILQP
jgi:hypothetical protein